MEDPEIVDYLLAQGLKEDYEYVVASILEAGNDQIVKIVEKEYNYVLNNVDYMNDVLINCIEQQNLLCVKNILNVSGNIIDCDRAIEIAKQENIREIVEILLDYREESL